jgi:tetratricopeptide (TPR) repeat protein
MLQPNAETTETADASRAAAEARAAADSGDWNAARAAMARAIDVSPNDAGYHAHMAWYSSLADALPAFERQRLAEHHLSVAFEIDANSADAHYVQGLLWAGDGNTTRARIALSTALKLRPDHRGATTALDRLSDKPQEAPVETPGTSFVPGARRRPKLRLSLIVGGALTALITAGGFLFSPETRAMNDLAQQLGTKMSIESVSRVSQDLYIDVGGAWDNLSAEQRASEIGAIAQHAGGLGVTNVFVYARSQPVAETHELKTCIGSCSSPRGLKGKSVKPAPTPEAKAKRP